MLKLIIGTAGSGKTARITREISQKVSRSETGIYMIVPEQFSHEAERELCAVCGDRLSLHAEVISFSRLAVRVAQEMGTGNKVFLDGGGRLLCISLALSQIGSKLKLYSSAQHNPRLLLELLQTIEELKNSLISSSLLENAIQSSSGELALKLSDLALCLEAYEAILAQGHADSADRLLRLAETIGGSGICRGGQVYVDGFTDFTGAESLVIEELLKAGVPVTVCLTCDGLHSDSEQFEPARIAANKLQRFCRKSAIECIIETADYKGSKALPLHNYYDHLFNYTFEKFDNVNGAISVCRANDLRSECEAAAARCIGLVRDTGCRWGDIAIAARNFSDYAAALEESFKFYGVPIFTAKRGSIMQKPLPALVEAAFQVISGGWDHQDVLTYIKTGLTGISQDGCDRLSRYAALWNIQGSGWTRPADWKQHPEGMGAEETAESAEALSELNALRRALVSPLMRLFKNGQQSETAGEQVQALARFFSDIDLPVILEQHAKALDEAGMSHIGDEFSQLWGILCKSMEQFSALLGDTHMNQTQFSELFLKMLAQYDVASIPFTPDSVSAGEIDRMRRRNIKHLIFMGASDDRIPALTENKGLLTEDNRIALEEAGLTLPSGGDSLPRELSLIYNCVTLPSETLTFSYCMTDANGDKTRPCFLIGRATGLFDIEARTADCSRLRLSAQNPAFLLAAGAEKSHDRNSALAYEYFRQTPEGEQRLELLKQRADKSLGKLSRDSNNALYGKTLRISPSRADAFFSCKLYYFLRYGLKLNEREKAQFDPPELGTYMHYVLEKCAAEISETVGFKNTTPALAATLTDKYTDLYISEKLGGFEEKSPRFVFLFNRLRPQVKRVVADMLRELSVSDFAPLRFELSFNSDGELPAIHLENGEDELFVNGTADRVDGYFKDGKLYLRVMDYKTGKKAFSLSDIWYGMGMQMLLYLFSLEREGGKIFEGEIIPAGVLYVPARDNLISSPGDLSDDELSREKGKQLRRSGLLLNDEALLYAMENSHNPEYIPVKYKSGEVSAGDSLAGPEQLALLRGHIDKRLLELSRDIAEGDIQARPCYKSASDNACTYCPYESVCRFDQNSGERLYLSKIKTADFWQRLGGEGDE